MPKRKKYVSPKPKFYTVALHKLPGEEPHHEITSEGEEELSASVMVITDADSEVIRVREMNGVPTRAVLMGHPKGYTKEHFIYTRGTYHLTGHDVYIKFHKDGVEFVEEG